MTAITGESDFGYDKKNEYPNSLDCIDGNLWLGNLTSATDIKVLKGKKIKSILTVNSFPLPEEIAGLNYITTKYINVFDTSKGDLLSHFDETFEFLETSLREGPVLVHCLHGVSRSPTIVMAYLMKKRNITVEAALDCVRSKRSCIGPNPDFLAQLKLYEVMKWSLDKNNIQYKKFRLHIAAEHMKEENVLPEHCDDVIKPDPRPQATNLDCTVYRCRKCRTVLVQDCNEVPHAEKEKLSWNDCKWSEIMERYNICQQIYFIEPIKWMENVRNSPEGKLSCPNGKCKNKLGSFNWISGCLCPCGTNVRPAFYLIPSKVDKVKKVVPYCS